MSIENQIKIRLSAPQDELWKRFSSHTTEMVVTKSGRKMFPKLEYIVDGLREDDHYAMVLQIEAVDERRYKFSNGAWVSSGRADARSEAAKKIWHADGVMTGKQWMMNPIGFERVKITNNPNDTCPSNIFLHSMHKYIPVLTIYESPSNSPFLIPSQASTCVATSRIPYTEFVAVTAYQNQSVTSLKIAHNPFAKGFREGHTPSISENRKRSSPSSAEGSTNEEASSSPSSQLSSPQPKKSKTTTYSSTMSPSTPIAPAMFTPFPFSPLPYPPFYFQQLAATGGFPASFIPFFSAFQFQNSPTFMKPEIKPKLEENDG